MPLLLQLAYHGAGLHGASPVPSHPTLHSVLAEAFSRLGLQNPTFEALSRTDAGVHARAQLVYLHADGDPAALLAALTTQLPPTIRCLGVAATAGSPVVRAKSYSYTLELSPIGDPMLADRAWRVQLDPSRLQPLAATLLGRQDFEPYRRRGETRADLVREIFRSEWSFSGEIACYHIRANGFAYHLVRSLVGGMVQAARLGRDAPLTDQCAPALGLSLDEIELQTPPTFVTLPAKGPIWSRS